ncbi:Proliferating cell nuclear antigen [Babesia sp. Xinjiang]|uniref:Proliferating cell nuclear antigen n=1 Tax=Babesia sp. Xinjiang TaxID=462227 RepID=UPI000A25F140|nr:Proliferating cell nuclear antigen [Babesia sp. Xinjiang]ORM41308.1 Proliferating cell nuclear antigen [Babesia sp. Xinjiang]
MLELKLNHAVVLRRIFDCMRDIISDGNIDFDATGMSLQALDGNHVALVHLKLHESGFSLYRCDRPRALGINLNSVTKAFKSCSNHDSVLIQSEEEKDYISFVFENNVDERVMSFSLKLMSIEQDALSIPENTEGYDAEITLGSKELANICKQMNEFSDTIKIDVSVNAVSFATQGDLGFGEIVLKNRPPTNESDCGVSVKVRRPIKQSYATKYLLMFSKSCCLSDVVTIGLCQNRPIEVKYDVRDSISDSDAAHAHVLGELKFYLAPKVDDTVDADM